MAHRPTIGEILVRAGAIDDYQLRSALGEQKRWGRRLGATLVKMGFVEEEDLTRALAEQLNLPVAQLEGKRVHQDVLDLVPGDFAQKHMCLPLFVKRQDNVTTLYLGMEDPSNLEVFDDLCFRTGMRVKPVMVPPSQLCEAIDRFYRGVSVEPFRAVESTPLETSEPEPEPETLDSGEDRPAPVRDAEDELSFVGEIPGLETRAEESIAASPQSEEPVSRVEASNRVILRALTQILIENGVVGRDEFHTRVRALQDAEDSS
jgi:type IV pilus assembly protein PilB